MDPQASTPQAITYPLTTELDAPLKIARWRPFLHGIMSFPHFIILYGLFAIQSAITFIAFFIILFTKTYPEGMFRVATMAMRYQWRTITFMLFLREPYPPFEFNSDLQDPGTDPAKLTIEYPGELNRWLPLVKWLLAIPHYFILLFLMLGGFFVWIISGFAVLFTGKYPQGMRDYMVGIGRWGNRVTAYVNLMTDVYPPFSLD